MRSQSNIIWLILQYYSTILMSIMNISNYVQFPFHCIWENLSISNFLLLCCSLKSVNMFNRCLHLLTNYLWEESADLLTLYTKNIAHPSAAELIKTHHQKGKPAFREFFNSLGDDTMFYKPIKKNKIDFFGQDQAGPKVTKERVLKDDCRLFSQLFISCQSRECDLLEFMKHENQSFLQHWVTMGNFMRVKNPS